MKKTQEIFYVHIGRSSFVKKDIDIIQTRHQLREHHFRVKKKWMIPICLMWQIIYLIANWSKFKIVISQFAGYHTLIPGWFARLKGIPFLIVAGGTESVRYPSIAYGNFAKGMYGFFTRESFRVATHVAPVHQSLAKSENHYYTQDGIYQGFLTHIPGLEVPITVIANGYDPQKWQADVPRRPNSFITVAHIWSRSRYTLKGVDLILEMGKQFPDYQFTVVGISYTPKQPIPANVTFIQAVDHYELPALFSSHEFYFQLSISEGHPNALCEAMLCQCVPIVSKVSSMPEIVGETGFVVSLRDKEVLTETIIRATSTDTHQLGSMARQRIEERYPLNIRQEQFCELLDQLLSDS